MLSPTSINHKFYWSFFLAVWFAISWVINYYVRSIGQEIRREGIASRIDVTAVEIIVDALNVETGIRGMLAGNDRGFLQPYYEGASRIDREIAVILGLTENDPVEHATAERIRDTYQILGREFANQVILFEQSGVIPARERFNAFPTKPNMDELRSQIDRIHRTEQTRLQANMETLESRMAVTIRMLDLFMVVVGFLFMAMISGVLSPPINIISTPLNVIPATLADAAKAQGAPDTSPSARELPPSA